MDEDPMVIQARLYAALAPAGLLADLVVIGCLALRRDRPAVRAAMFTYQDVEVVVRAAG